MSKPIVAVVGRPNVGKSTLFNKLCGQRLAIVEDTPGITRDRIFANCEWNGHEFLLVDTGGIEPKATEGILAHMREQAQIAIDTADCIIMVVDVRDGLTAADEDVAHMLRRSHKPIILAVNKCDKVGGLQRNGGGRGPHPGGHHRPPQRGQVQPDQPHPGREPHDRGQ